MKKFLVCLIVMSFCLPSYAWFWNKKDKNLEKMLEGKGYAGTLPSLEEQTEPARKKKSSPIFETQDNFNNPEELKPVPKDNPAFINIIEHKNKPSEYQKDVDMIIPMLEKVMDCIEDNENLQLFISKSNLLTSNIDYLIDKYKGKPESYSDSFKKLTDVNRYAKSIMTLRQEAVTYQRFLAYSESGSVYNPQNIAQQLEYLKQEINSTIISLKEER